MLFSSAIFVFLFLPLLLALYFVVHPRLRNFLLLLASLLFYAWGEPLLSVVLLISILANWLLGLWVESARARGRGRGALAIGVAFNLLLLLTFKYADWLWDSLGGLLMSLHAIDHPLAHLGSYLGPESILRKTILAPDETIRLPLGISFFTFQATSYLIDIFRGDVESERSVINFGMYKSFFPQLIAGPIVRYRDVHVQIHRREHTVERFAEGVRRFVIGLGKKMLIANACAEACDKVFGTATVVGVPAAELTPAIAWLGIIAYTLQIYFDFSGYSDMAIGLGRMFGFTFLANFNYPYISRSITEFWRRWHISLSSWFRDYLYIPLGGNRGTKARTYRNLIFVFFLCGLWHGANVTFVVWGLFHGAFLVMERAGLGAWLDRRPAVLRHAYTMLVVIVGWVFFRATTMSYALSYLAAMFGIVSGSQLVHVPHPPIDDAWIAASLIHPVALYASSLTWTAIVAGGLGSMPWLPHVRRWTARLFERGRTAAWVSLQLAGMAGLAVVFVLVAMDLAGGAYNPFIYFRF
jgi:alginate O-acetyltransferase complex protein AlgI